MENLNPEVKEIKDAICDIRSASNYSGSIYFVKEKLKLPDSVTDYEIEALLIYAIREQFGESLDADMVLMALGLLKGFDSPRNPLEDRSGKELITERRKMFIEKSSYVADRHNHNNKRRKRHYESWEELKAAGGDAIDVVVNGLGSEEATNIEKVAQKLHGKRRIINEYLDKAKEYLIYDEKGNIVDVELQELKNIRQEPINDVLKDELEKSDEQGLKSDSIQDDFPPVIEQEKESESLSSSQTKDSGHSFCGDWRDILTKCLIFGLIALFAVLIFIIIVLLVVTRRNDNSAQKAFSEAMKQKERIPPDKIEIKDNNIYLPLGGDYYLYVDIGIDGLDTDNLKCESLNPDIVKVLARTDEYIKISKGLEDDIKYDSGVVEYHIRATKKLKRNAKNSTDIVVHNSNRDFPKDEVTITVIDPTIHVDSRSKNDTKSPGKLE